MCEKCEARKKVAGGEPVPEKFMEDATKHLIELADRDIEAKEGMGGIDGVRLAQENEAMRTATGVTLERVWEIYEELKVAGEKGEPYTLSPTDARGFNRWITILARSRAALMSRLEEAEGLLQMAVMLEQIREAGGAPKDPTKLPMVDLGYGLAGNDKGPKRGDN